MLTGAGFTNNFKGFLAKDMRSFIFNDKEIKKRPRILEITDSDYDYESIYYKIHNDPKYDSKDKKAINDAIYNAYQKLDDTIRKVTDANNLLSIHDVNEMIEFFSGEKGGGGYFFTLNQDLLIERRYKFRTLLTQPLPNDCKINLVGEQTRLPLKPKDFKTLPSKEKLGKEKTKLLSESRLRYIKLHGSFNWYSFDGSKMMVIGKDKKDQMIKEPLLSWYYELFENALCQNETKLFVIGYSFMDEHINEVIANSMNDCNLQLYIILSTELEKLKERLDKLQYASLILKKSSNYFYHEYRLSKLILEHQDIWDDIKKEMLNQ